ncbi:hypothetical protein A5731_00490 [Mycolicibacterium conceptionense]|uniref:DUF4326 domain-containing protein n=1 Tax=Mycolicibacterium conceptionense TaxID=451644 RepID=UPI0007E98E75|nr:DUF4326 domain-containing protein [Mycolicibacterium conceptionense]OBB15480.1 hypothetical protein A5718_29880 [Mycolicibacterium conceptionense]OBF09222.1 hypothetical protein A5731_00490 [Mycolicibacterium conceptionense]
MPERIQRKRTKGWRMPEGAIYVGRGSQWGNPWRVGDRLLTVARPPLGETGYGREFVITPEIAVAFYRQAFALDYPDIVDALRGHDLACWCPLDSPCHADVLLEIANA